MATPKKKVTAGDKPGYVVDLEVAYGPPSQEGFGGAVFFESSTEKGDLEDLAKSYYQHFVGDKWEEWGEDTWMAPWKEVYVRKAGTKHDVEKELRGIDDIDATISVPLVLDLPENPAEARKALSAAYDATEVAGLRAYTIGDGEAMSGLLVAGWRENGETIILVVLMD